MAQSTPQLFWVHALVDQPSEILGGAPGPNECSQVDLGASPLLNELDRPAFPAPGEVEAIAGRTTLGTSHPRGKLERWSCGHCRLGLALPEDWAVC